VTGNKNWFIELDKSVRHTARLRNNKVTWVCGKERVRFEVEGNTQNVSDVYFLPNLTNNLLSMGHNKRKTIYQEK